MSEQVVDAREVQNYKDEWKRTNPDIVVYKPASKFGADSFNLHFCVIKSRAGKWSTRPEARVGRWPRVPK